MQELPAAQTHSVPLFVAYETAFFIVREKPPPPSDMLITSAPWSAAHLIASAMSSMVPPNVPSARHDSSRELLIPATPVPLPVVAEAIPATWVPWYS